MFFNCGASEGRESLPPLQQALGLSVIGHLLSRPQIHTSSVAYFASKQAVFFKTKIATSQAEREGHHETQGTDTCPKGCSGPSFGYAAQTSDTVKAWEAWGVTRTLCVFHQFVTVVIWQGRGASKVTAAAARQKRPTVVSWWMDLLMLNMLQKQESEGEETLCREWAREAHPRPPPARQEPAAPDHRAPEPDDAAPIQEGVSGCAASAHPGFSSI